MLAAKIAHANNESLEEGAISRSTVRRERIANRSETAKQLRENFKGTGGPLVIHWDGKIMKDTTKKETDKTNVERLAVVVSGLGIEKILGISKISSGEGHAQANATYQLLQIWDAVDDIIGMSFDTTASNTGLRKGACALLQTKIGRNLLHLPCRHHIHEVLIAAVFTKLFGSSSGPNITLFQRFQKH